jgi:hypothetical protein
VISLTFTTTPEVDQGLVIDLIPSEQLCVVAKVAQKPTQLPHGLGCAVQAAGHEQEPEALVVSALFGYCHDEDSTSVLVGQIAFQVNAWRKRIGEEADLKPRLVGSILRSLGLATDKLDSFGRGLRLTAAVKRRIHQLEQIYDVTSTDRPRIEGCSLCEEMMKAYGAEPADAPPMNV